MIMIHSLQYKRIMGSVPGCSKKAKQTNKDELRAEYVKSAFPTGLVRGKYSGRMHNSSNIVVLRPEVAEAFPNEEAVNSALLSLIKLAQQITPVGKCEINGDKKMQAT